MKTNFYILWDDQRGAWLRTTATTHGLVHLKSDATPWPADKALQLMDALGPHILAEYVFTRHTTTTEGGHA